MNKIIVKATVASSIEIVWAYWTKPEHVINWNFASPDWHCPAATSNLVPGGEFSYTMAAKDGSVSFDLNGTFEKVEPNKFLSYFLEDGRHVTVEFIANENSIEMIESFEPEEVNALDLQESGWQAILNNFKLYVEG
jgi:uncharacterized protein YndB with AHSA1/START domain